MLRFFFCAISLYSLAMIGASGVFAADSKVSEPTDSVQLNAEDESSGDSDEAQSSGQFVMMPVPVSSPEFGAGLGINMMYLHKPATPETPPSSTFLYTQYTSNKSKMLIVGHDHFWADDAWRGQLYAGLFDLNMKHYYDKNNVALKTPLPFNSKSGFVYGSLMKRIATNWYAGAQYFNSKGEARAVEDRPMLGREHFKNMMSGASQAVGLKLSFDSRDSVFNSTEGSMFDVSTWHYSPRRVGSKPYDVLELSAAHFITLKPNHVLAMQAKTSAGFGSMAAYEMPVMDIRGTSYGKYRGKLTAQTELEYRWRFKPQWTWVGFTGIGAVAPSSDQLNETNYVPVAGMGLRYLLAEEAGVNVGIDYAVSKNGDNAWYIRLGEAF